MNKLIIKLLWYLINLYIDDLNNYHSIEYN